MQGMSRAVPGILAPESVFRSQPVRRLFVTLLLIAALTASLSLLAPLEHRLFGSPGIADSPVSNLVLILGMPHLLLGFAFMLSSTATSGLRHWLPIGAALLIGLGFEYLLHHYAALDTGRRLGSLVVGLYFFFHTYRDEWFFRSRDADRPASNPIAPVMLTLIALVAAYECAVWSASVLVGDPAHNLRHYLNPAAIDGVDRRVLWLSVAAPSAAFAVLAHRCSARLAGAGFPALVRRDPALWLVYGMIFAVFVISALAGAKLAAIILIHVVTWWAFMTRGLSQRKRTCAGVTGTLAALGRSLRTTQAGFQAVHGLLVASFLCLLTLYTHDVAGMHGGILDYVLTQNAFLYWTVMHVTLSVFPGLIRSAFGWEATR